MSKHLGPHLFFKITYIRTYFSEKNGSVASYLLVSSYCQNETVGCAPGANKIHDIGRSKEQRDGDSGMP
eukprot:6143498-Pyramimonas_sp.AAC.1